MNKLQDFFSDHQMIRFATVLSIITIGFIGTIFGLSMLMQIVHGQEAVPTCTIYNSEVLKVLSLLPNCGGNPYENIVYYLNLGYHIVASNNDSVFLVK